MSTKDPRRKENYGRKSTPEQQRQEALRRPGQGRPLDLQELITLPAPSTHPVELQTERKGGVQAKHIQTKLRFLNDAT